MNTNKNRLFANPITRHLSKLFDGEKQIASLERMDGNYPLIGDEICKAVNERDNLIDALEQILKQTEKILENNITLSDKNKIILDIRSIGISVLYPNKNA